jgi:F0F1-type ATP synthase membrane subunit b/b'
MDSKLVSMVNDLESEAERVLQEARDQAAATQRKGESDRARLAEEKLAGAKREAERLVQSSRQKTLEDLDRRRADEKASLGNLLHRAEARLEKASRLILDRLGKL